MTSLPSELKYLKPVLAELAKVSADDLNEDYDVSALEAALRKRVKGLKLRDAISRLTKDRDALRQWMAETKTSNAAISFLAGWFIRPGPLARTLLAPPPPPEPTVEISVPSGWLSRTRPGQLILEKAKFFAVFTVIDARDYTLRRLQNEAREKAKPSANRFANILRWSGSTVRVGECQGLKYTYLQIGTANWKAVEYLLEVPGGFIEAHLSHQAGKDFDQSEIEKVLNTLKVIPPPSR